MILWRLVCPYFRSSRYAENLIIVFSFASAYFLVNWNSCVSFPQKAFPIVSCIKGIVILSFVVFLLINYFHHNQYQDYADRITECIQHDTFNEDSVVVNSSPQYVYLDAIPQNALPGFLKEKGRERDDLLRMIRQYQNISNHLYLTTNNPLREFDLPSEDAKRIIRLGQFQKNRHQKMIYLFRYDCSERESSLELNGSSDILGNNLIANGDFEEQYPSGIDSYYNMINNSPKKGVIPQGACFPKEWDIFWGIGFNKKTVASVCSCDKDPISGNYSLRVQSNKTIGILYNKSFASKKYQLQFDIMSLKKCSIGIQLNLRDSNRVFRGYREMERVSLSQVGHIYHYNITLTEDMIYPFDHFYLYFFFYDKSDVLIDNVILTDKGSH